MNHGEDCFHLGVKALIHNPDGKLLLLRVNVETFKHVKDSYWDIPGGRIQKNEPMEAALKREVYEETGLVEFVNLSPPMMVLSNIRIPTETGDVGLILAAYRCKVTHNAIISLSKEHTDFGWFEPKEAAQLLAIKYPIEFTEKL